MVMQATPTLTTAHPSALPTEPRTKSARLNRHKVNVA